MKRPRSVRRLRARLDVVGQEVRLQAHLVGIDVLAVDEDLHPREHRLGEEVDGRGERPVGRDLPPERQLACLVGPGAASRSAYEDGRPRKRQVSI